MLKEEFEKINGNEISAENYAVIEKVYMWHPSFENSTKEQVVSLYEVFGMGPFKGMHDTALALESMEKRLRQMFADTTKLKREIDDYRANVK